MKPKAGLLYELMQTQTKRTGWIRLLSVALGLMTILQAVLLAQAVQYIFVDAAPVRLWLPVIAALLIVMLLRTAIAYRNGAIGLRIAADAKRTLRSTCLRSLTSQPLLFARQGQTGSKISIAMDAVDEADSYFSQYTPKMIEASIVPLMILGCVFLLHVPSGLILLFTAPFIPLFMALIGIQTRQKSVEKFQQLAQFSGTFLDSVQGLLTLKLFGRTQTQQAQIARYSGSYRDSTMGILKVAFMNTFALETIVMLGIGIVALELALQLVVFKTMTFHIAFLILLLVPEFYNLLKNVGIAFHSGRTSLGAIRTIEALLAEEPQIVTTAQLIQPPTQQPNNQNQICSDTTIHHCAIDDTIHRLQPSSFSNDCNDATYTIGQHQQQAASSIIAWQQLRFCYGRNEAAFVLNAGSLHIPYGHKVAIVGQSGAGKTTLLHLIAGLLQPSSGEIRFNNQPLTPDRAADGLAQMSYITQHPYIFAGTLADNIAIATDRDVSRAEIAAAAQSAGLETLVAALEHGYDTVVGEGGRGLSGGERQRLALARAFLKQPSLLLFDEPTAGLDLHTEQILLESINKLAQQATVITIAHRLHTIRHADLILFMEQGNLLATGTHDELLATLPQYAAMIRLQRPHLQRQEVLL
ncbi:thiol reductant ABC exporter subunit CydD [Paenibacillus campi]|uniref:thiol reductant ABC exporter subunit CydD n=1 Tax=Paenibacillus campi TaxID=3106031 RepID=UPI002AFEAAB1|nr:thiol reductant ABC exporter subunit CydD [Paenibacillus sp. SGZ-1009]